MIKTIEFDPASYLDNADVIAEYIRLALSSGDSELLLSAIADVEKAKGQINPVCSVCASSVRARSACKWFADDFKKTRCSLRPGRALRAK